MICDVLVVFSRKTYPFVRSFFRPVLALCRISVLARKEARRHALRPRAGLAKILAIRVTIDSFSLFFFFTLCTFRNEKAEIRETLP